MMLDGKAEVKAEFITERQFAPQLLVPLRRRHPRFVPHVRKMGEFHVARPLAVRRASALTQGVLRLHAASRTRAGRERVINSFHRRQNTCICNSSDDMGAWRVIPREMSDHSTSRTVA